MFGMKRVEEYHKIYTFKASEMYSMNFKAICNKGNIHTCSPY